MTSHILFKAFDWFLMPYNHSQLLNILYLVSSERQTGGSFKDLRYKQQNNHSYNQHFAFPGSYEKNIFWSHSVTHIDWGRPPGEFEGTANRAAVSWLH